MPAGEAFTERQIADIARAAKAAVSQTGLNFSVFVGQSEGPPARYADRLLAALGNQATNSVLILVDPSARRVEVVTGRDAASRLDDRSCGLACLSMTSSFSGGDLTGGITTGLRMLGDSVVWARQG
ncbi:MAG: hypothetical protein QOG53_1345 [Frankiales bacterium]|nr:hypothetical protein [Frankiales bacterium]